MHYLVAYLPDDIPKCIFKQVTHFYLRFWACSKVKIQRANLCKEGSSFVSSKNPFNHFHNRHFQIYQQGLSCSLYVQPLKQAQGNYQTYLLKDNLSEPSDL